MQRKRTNALKSTWTRTRVTLAVEQMARKNGYCVVVGRFAREQTSEVDLRDAEILYPDLNDEERVIKSGLSI